MDLQAVPVRRVQPGTLEDQATKEGRELEVRPVKQDRVDHRERRAPPGSRDRMERHGKWKIGRELESKLNWHS